MESDSSSLDHTHSVTRCLGLLREQDPEAAKEIWRRYFAQLLPLARARLRSLSDRTVDEEDILVSVFDRFFRAAREDRFPDLHDRHDLWQILLMLTERKVIEQFRKSNAQKRGRGRGTAEPSDSVIANLAEQQPGPEFVAAFNDSLVWAIGRLDPEKTREIAIMKLEGFDNREVADRLGISVSSVERKLRLIREYWRQELD